MTTYTTKDFNLSAFLLSNGLNLQSTYGDNGKTYFTFVDSVLAEKMAADYFGLKASVNPITYSNALKTLKMIIYNEKHNEQFQSQPTRTK